MTTMLRKAPKGTPRLNIARGMASIPPPTHELKIASAAKFVVRPCSPAIIEKRDERIIISFLIYESLLVTFVMKLSMAASPFLLINDEFLEELPFVLPT